MPRGKKEVTFTKKEMKDTLLNCRSFTTDQVRMAVQEACNRENIEAETAQRIAATLETIVSNSFSKIMASSGV